MRASVPDPPDTVTENLPWSLASKAKISLWLFYGDKDTAVPHVENPELVFDRYEAIGGPVERVVKPGQDHHPHGLKDATPGVKFFTAALEPKK